MRRLKSKELIGSDLLISRGGGSSDAAYINVGDFASTNLVVRGSMCI